VEPEKPTAGSAPRLTSTGPQQSSSPYSAGPRGQGPYTQPPRGAKPKRRWLPALAIAAVLGAGAVGAHYYTGVQDHVIPLSTVASSTQQTLTLSGADLDEATTAAAITAIRSGQNDNPLISKLTQKQKQEIVSGERKFYKLPIGPVHTAQHAPSGHVIRPQADAAPSTPPASATPTKRAASPVRHTPRHHAAVLQPAIEQSASPQAPPQDAGPQDRIQIVLDGVIYGTYNVTNSPLTLDAPLMRGDVWGVTCLELSPGKSSVTIGIANVLNPVQTTLSVGQTTTWTVGPSTTAPDYGWFHTQAESGNAVAEYGLGHMYEYGIGEPQDMAQAVHWYQQAANQNYRDARQRLAELGQ
jgi:hypothetical protein